MLLKVVGYYDLSVLSMSVMGYPKKVWMGWVGGVSSIQFYFGFLEFFKLCKAPKLGRDTSGARGPCDMEFHSCCSNR